ncbi:hypothetical protein QE152_g26931 [Popillia japonica]|uniref:Reverse transcriptase n=1 Tax=Popillia japonica TaxID=7064 RepID=A0AAW1JVC6_POPJA
MEAITHACETMPRKKSHHRKRPTYWWNQEIADLRRECLRLRRAAQRHRNGNEAETIAIEHREAKRELRRAINRSKALCWKQVTEEVNADPEKNRRAGRSIILPSAVYVGHCRKDP